MCVCAGSWQKLHLQQLRRSNRAALPRKRPPGFWRWYEEPKMSAQGAVAKRTSSDLMLTLRTRSKSARGDFIHVSSARVTHALRQAAVQYGWARGASFHMCKCSHAPRSLTFHKRFPHPGVKKRQLNWLWPKTARSLEMKKKQDLPRVLSSVSFLFCFSLQVFLAHSVCSRQGAFWSCHKLYLAWY